MLVLTPTAVAVVNELTEAQGQTEAGLRIYTDAEQPPEGALRVEIAPGPVENDQVLDEAGAKVYLDPLAASELDDMVLDANIDDEGLAQFHLRAQQPDGDGP